MAENTGISWADHTVNFWHGCQKVSEACRFCYAERLDARFHGTVDTSRPWSKEDKRAPHWGKDAPRLLRVEAATQEAMRYQRRAVKEGRRFRVFTNSMADFFEDRRDLDQARLAALDVIRQTPDLCWMILTKRPENITRFLKKDKMKAWYQGNPALMSWLSEWLSGAPPKNVWCGTTAESQEWADKRVPELLKVPAAVRFLSCEPLLAPIDLGRWLGGSDETQRTSLLSAGGLGVLQGGPRRDDLAHEADGRREQERDPNGFVNHSDMAGLDWIIAGSESGPNRRPFEVEWVRSLKAQCREAGVAFFYKQGPGAGSKGVEITPGLDGEPCIEFPKVAQ